MCVSNQQRAFYEELINIQSTYKKRLGANELFLKLGKNQALERMRNGLPLISFEEIKIKEEIIKDILNDVCNILIKYGLCKEGEVEELKTANFAKLKAAVLKSNKERESSLNTFVFVSVARIILGSIVNKLEVCLVKDSIDLSQWLQGYCPMCGNLPLIAKLRKEDGKRFLQCSICFTQWQFARIKCIYCGTEDQKDLRFFWVENTSSPNQNDFYRVDVCDKCKRYIKTIDERKIQEGRELNPLIEDMNTAYLDILAAKEGYHKM